MLIYNLVNMQNFQKPQKRFVTILMIVLGALLILAGIANGIYLYIQNNSPLDVVDTSVEQLDQNNDFIPLVQPEPEPSKTVAITNNSGITIATLTPTEVAGLTQVAATGYIPDRVVIPSIQLDAPIVPIHFKVMHLDNQTYEQWLVPNKFAAGWHETSALLGKIGNTVLNGHHNVYGKVFRNLVKLEKGDEIDVYSGSKVFKYIVDTKLLLPERFQTIEKREENAKWIMPTTDERLTLVTCWPADSNTHRVIIVAFPAPQK